MKKLFALTLAVVMVLAVASSAMAFSWGKPADDTADNFASRYKIEVVKLANETGIIGTSKLIEAPGATAVNNASVYFYVRLTVSGIKNPADAVQDNVSAEVSFTALQSGSSVPFTGSTVKVDNAKMPKANGVYYLELAKGEFKTLDDSTFAANSAFSKAAIEGRVLDTATAKVYAKVSANRPFTKKGVAPDPDTPIPFNYGSYDITVNEALGTILFSEADTDVGKGTAIATFKRDGNGKVTEVTNSPDGQKVAALYQWLNAGSADAIYTAIKNGEMYMTNGNIRAAFGFDYKGESSITWNANPTAIILDPNIGVGIPKTGDNASIIGFALVMIAVVGAAVAVKKVRA